MEPDKRLRQSLESYKNLAEDFANHETMLKDRTILSYVAYVMSMPKPELVELGMEILELFAGNGDNWLHLTSTFGVREALEAVSETHGQSELGLRAQLLRERIEGMKPPIHNLRSRCRRVIEPRRLKTHVIVLHVQGLLPETRADVEGILIRVEGLISLVVDVEHQRVTMRTLSYVTPKQIAEAIHKNTENMEARLVTRNKYNQEFLVTLVRDKADSSEEDVVMPDYLPEEEEQEEKEGVVSLFTGLRQNASSLYKSTVDFFHNSFYW